MNLLIDIFLNFIGAAFLSLFLTVLGVCLLFFLIKGFYPKYTFTLVSFLTGIVLFFFLLFQTILLSGAVEVKSMTDVFEIKIHQAIPAYYEGNEITISPLEVQALLDNLIAEYPLLGYYVDTAEFHGYNSMNISQAFINELDWFLTKYIWRRIGWCALFVVGGAFIVIKTMNTFAPKRERRRPVANRSYRRR